MPAACAHCLCLFPALTPHSLPVCPPGAGTLAMNDQLDLLAEFMGVGGDVARVTNHVRPTAWQAHSAQRVARHSRHASPPTREAGRQAGRPALRCTPWGPGGGELRCAPLGELGAAAEERRGAPLPPPPTHPPTPCWPSPQAMDGSMSLEAALEERLRIINCTPADIRAFLDAHPAGSRLSPVRRGRGLWPGVAAAVEGSGLGVRPQGGGSDLGTGAGERLGPPAPPPPPPPQGGLELVQALQARGVAVYLLSGGFR